eukprot:scaffold109812_cov41-Tisochrysis_lutea.AAC.2
MSGIKVSSPSACTARGCNREIHATISTIRSVTASHCCPWRRAAGCAAHASRLVTDAPPTASRAPHPPDSRGRSL